MKNLKITIAVLSILFFSCSKDEEITHVDVPQAIVEENAQNTFLTSTGFNQEVTPTSEPIFKESGYSFKPNVNGKIMSFIVKSPLANGNMRVTLWDNQEETIIKSQVLADGTGGVETVFKLSTPIVLDKNKTYTISRSYSGFYTYRRTDFRVINFPIVTTNFTFIELKSGIYNGTTAVFPSNISTGAGSYRGDVSFGFLKTE